MSRPAILSVCFTVSACFATPPGAPVDTSAREDTAPRGGDSGPPPDTDPPDDPPADNRAPRASVRRPEGDVLPGDQVSFDARSSSDPDGDLLSFAWSVQTAPEGASPVLAHALESIVDVIFDTPGEHVLSLVVDDGRLQDDLSVRLTVLRDNAVPIAHAGVDQFVTVGQEVQLDGRGSYDPDGDTLTFLWSFAQRPGPTPATLLGPTTVLPTFVPDAPGFWVAELTVSDGMRASVPDTVQITASAP